MENTVARQLLEVRTDLPSDLPPYERQIAAREAEALVLRLSPLVVRIAVPEELRPRVVVQLELP